MRHTHHVDALFTSLILVRVFCGARQDWQVCFYFLFLLICLAFYMLGCGELALLNLKWPFSLWLTRWAFPSWWATCHLPVVHPSKWAGCQKAGAHSNAPPTHQHWEYCLLPRCSMALLLLRGTELSWAQLSERERKRLLRKLDFLLFMIFESFVLQLYCSLLVIRNASGHDL